MNFVKFTECNEWEGETWNFYIPYDNNAKELTELAFLFQKFEKDFPEDFNPYTLEINNLISEFDVDDLCKQKSNTTYLNEHNKLIGKLNLADMTNIDDDLYKGGIERFVK